MKNRVDVVYSAGYQVPGLSHFHRLALACDMAQARELVHLHSPEPLGLTHLRVLHEASYVEAMLLGQMPLAGSSYLPWSPALMDACLLMLGGQQLAAQLAFAHGVAINLACGFHHALPDRGGGYCVFNGLALIALLYPKLRVAVLDCDEHGGDGTEAFCPRLANLSAISIFGSRFGVRGGLRSRALEVPRIVHGSDQEFLEALDQALAMLIEESPDIVLYQASADSHQDDSRSTLRLATGTLAERDRRVFRTFRQLGIPVLTTLAGGYQSPERTAALYVQTIALAAAERG